MPGAKPEQGSPRAGPEPEQEAPAGEAERASAGGLGPGASRRLQAGVVVAAALLLCIDLGSVDLSAPDEPRYGQVAEELRRMERGTRDLVLLRLGGEAYTHKPPLYFWAAAALGAAGGRVDEWAARLPSALSGVALVALTVVFGGRLLGGRAGVLGGAFLLTSWEFFRLGRRAHLDLPLALFETLALLLFWRIDRGLGPRRIQVAGLHGALGLAVLTKGPVGLLVPLLVMATYLLWERRPRALLRCLPPWGFALSLGPALLWLLAAVSLAPPGFAREMLGPNLLGRAVAGAAHARPLGYYLQALPLDLLPWSLLLPAIAWAALRRVFVAASPAATRRAWRLLLCWAGASLLFFSLLSGKRGLYLAPAFPAFALLLADSTLRLLAGRARMPTPGVTAAALLAAALGIAALCLALSAGLGLSFGALGELTRAWQGRFTLAFSLGALGIVAAGTAAWSVAARHRWSPLRQLAVAVAATFALYLAEALLLERALEPVRSPRPVARAAAAATPPGTPIGLVHDRAMLGGLLYYGERPVVPLPDARALRRFLAEGGGALVVKSHKRALVDAETPVEVVSRLRAGRRALLVLQPRSDAAEEGPARSTAPGPAHGASRRRAVP